MIRFVILVFMLGFLASCASTKPPTALTKEVYVAVKVPNSLYKCPQVRVRDFPHPDTATNSEVAMFITKLYTYNKQCGYSLDGIRRYLAAAEARLENDKKRN